MGRLTMQYGTFGRPAPPSHQNAHRAAAAATGPRRQAAALETISNDYALAQPIGFD